MTEKQGTMMERETARTAAELQTYSIHFVGGAVEITVTGAHREGQPILLHAEEDCAIHFHKPVFEHDIYWLTKNRKVELLPLHNGSTFDILRPVKAVTMIADGSVVKDEPRIPTSG